MSAAHDVSHLFGAGGGAAGGADGLAPVVVVGGFTPLFTGFLGGFVLNLNLLEYVVVPAVVL